MPPRRRLVPGLCLLLACTALPAACTAALEPSSELAPDPSELDGSHRDVDARPTGRNDATTPEDARAEPDAHTADTSPDAHDAAADARDSSSSACSAATTCADSVVYPRTGACTFLLVFDGSGVYSPDESSNVSVLYKEAAGPAATAGAQGKWSEVVTSDTTRGYIEGVPAFPWDASRERVERGRSALCQHLAYHAATCDVVLLGYSRGAIIANQLASVMNDYGCSDGAHVGTPIAFLGAFDPISLEMGLEWYDPNGNAVAWSGSVPSNVRSFLQVYKEPKQDPRGGAEGATLTSTPLYGGHAASTCDMPLTSAVHPNLVSWNHGEIGHWQLPRDVMRCGIEHAGVTTGP